MTPPLIGVDIDDTIAFWPPDGVSPSVPEEDAVEVLEQWTAEKIARIVYITSRKRARREETEGWLRHFGFPCADQVLYEEDTSGGKPLALRQRGAFALVDDMPGTAGAAASEGLTAYWHDIPKNSHMPSPAPHPKLHPWNDWRELDRLVRLHVSSGEAA